MVLSAMCIAALAACATGLTPRDPQIQWPAHYAAAQRKDLPPASLDRWWTLFDDAQLEALVERVLSQGLDARLALARLSEAQAVRAQSLSRYAPQGALQSSVEASQAENLNAGPNPDMSRNASVSLPVTWELDFFGRRAVTRTAADSDLAAARFDYEATRTALAAQVAQTLFQARGLAAQWEESRANAKIQADLLGLIDRRVERGLTAASQADRVAGDVSQANARALALASELDATRRSLLVLMGDGLAPITSIAIEAELAEAPAVPTTVPGDLMIRRPDIREAQARIRSAAGNLRLAELDFFPRLTLQPSIGLSSQRGPLDASTGFWSLGLGLSVPVLDRPRLQAALDLQSARGQQLVIAFEQLVQSAFAEVDQALTRLQADRRRVQILIEGERRANRAHEAALTRFRLGLGDLQEVLDAELAWRATRNALTSARLDALKHSVQAFKALGGGWPSDSLPASAMANP